MTKHIHIRRYNLIGISSAAVFVVAFLIGVAIVRHVTKPVSHALTCIPPTQYPSAPNGGMSYTNWYFDNGAISSLNFNITTINDPGNTSDLYLQLYDAPIDGTGQYFGLQTIGLAIFSRFGTVDTSNVQPGPGSTVVAGTNEGPFVSLRYSFGSMPAGNYSARMVRASFDGLGDWFQYFVTYPGQSERYIGAIRFPRANSSIPASFGDGGGTWTEFWDNNGTTLFPVPFWRIRYLVEANGGEIPDSAISAYSPMPNSDQYALTPGGLVDQIIGGSTDRCHPAGWLWYQLMVNSPPTSLTTTSTGPSSITFSWSPSTNNVGTAGYYIYRNGNFVGNVNATNFTDTGLASGTNYSYTVSAYDAAGIQSIQSNPVSFSTSSIQGDLNGDGKVNIYDLAIMLANWGKTGTTPSQGDLTGDGTVNIYDLALMLDRWTG